MDPKTGAVKRQSLLSAESAAKAEQMVSKMTAEVMKPAVYETLSPQEAKDIARSLLRSLTSIANAQYLARTNPLQADQKKAWASEYYDYETVLPRDYCKSSIFTVSSTNCRMPERHM